MGTCKECVHWEPPKDRRKIKGKCLSEEVYNYLKVHLLPGPLFSTCRFFKQKVEEKG
jgi:hypothetical protein